MDENKNKLLVVDDEAFIRQILVQKLSGDGFLCQEASDAEQALAKLRTNSFALVILDNKMPGKSGMELLPELRADYPDMAVIMATATSDTNIAIECMRLGAYDYITKPFELEDVVISVKRALEKRNMELQIREYQQHLEEKVAEQSEKIRTSFMSAIKALANALEAKDKYTSGHSQNVADIAIAIAGTMNLPEELIEKIKLAGLLHDIGKIGLSGSILNKPGDLNKEELLAVQKHPETGEHILAPIIDDKGILQLVRSHHERYDGTGYPDALKGNQILLGARILAVADAYEAMTSERPYRVALSAKDAITELERSKGTQFDPQIVDAFLNNVTGRRTPTDFSNYKGGSNI